MIDVLPCSPGPVTKVLFSFIFFYFFILWFDILIHTFPPLLIVGFRTHCTVSYMVFIAHIVLFVRYKMKEHTVDFDVESCSIETEKSSNPWARNLTSICISSSELGSSAGAVSWGIKAVSTGGRSYSSSPADSGSEGWCNSSGFPGSPERGEASYLLLLPTEDGATCCLLSN